MIPRDDTARLWQVGSWHVQWCPLLLLFHMSLPALDQHCLKQSINSWSQRFDTVSFSIFRFLLLFPPYNFRIFFFWNYLQTCNLTNYSPQLLCSPQEEIICGGTAPHQGWSSPHDFTGTGLRHFAFSFEFLPHSSLHTWESLSIGPVYNYLFPSILPSLLPGSIPWAQRHHTLSTFHLSTANSPPVFHLTKLPSPTQKVRDYDL